MTKTIVFNWGRYNPPTKGHEVVIDKITAISKKYDADAAVYLSKTHDADKNPLKYSEKLYYAKKAFGSIIKDAPEKDFFKLCRKLSKKYDVAYLVVGEDRVDDFRQQLENCGFQEYKVIMAGKRQEGAKDVTGISGTLLRKFVKNNQFEEFKELLPEKIQKYAEEIFNKIEKRINTSIEESRGKYQMKSFIQELREEMLKEYDDPDRDNYEKTASEWHGGQSSDMYKFMSSGIVDRDHAEGLLHEIERSLRIARDDGDIDKLEAFKDYVKERMLEMTDESSTEENEGEDDNVFVDDKMVDDSEVEDDMSEFKEMNNEYAGFIAELQEKIKVTQEKLREYMNHPVLKQKFQIQLTALQQQLNTLMKGRGRIG